MFNMNLAFTIVKIEGSIFAVGAEDGLHIIDMKRGKNLMHLFEGNKI